MLGFSGKVRKFNFVEFDAESADIIFKDLVFSVSAGFVKYFLTQSWVALKKVWDSFTDARIGGHSAMPPPFGPVTRS